ncbi:ABC transporter, permease component [Aquipluma nitroreducens]|uniref:ABC transporter, permease component n=1 Tax=Aquipluma nitroreducens TaxID=2010828 RepID=A0A5K7S3C6_9BACT|nr:MlaD family protein [Aquipluma nitroreducens]BBE16043.1 ABC transporter, permease component [Aquipluma nitroreducens]
MNESPNKRAVIVGVFVIVGLLFLLAGVLIVGNLRETFNRKMQLVSLFDDISGLQPGNNIWYSGVKIGTVNSLNFHGKSQVEVDMNVAIKAKKYIRKDAKVKISSDGLIGNKILVIYGGTDGFAEVEDGDTLLVEKTFTSEDMINTAQENNKNILAITNDVKIITKKLAAGEGTLGKLLNDSLIYTNINATIASLHKASAKAEQMLASLSEFSSGLNKKGTLANELTTDTVVFKSVKASVLQLQQMADTATVFIANLKKASSNPNSAIGVLLHDDESGTRLKETIKNLETSSAKLDEDLEAAQHNFLLRGYFKKKAKTEESSLPENKKQITNDTN